MSSKPAASRQQDDTTASEPEVREVPAPHTQSGEEENCDRHIDSADYQERV